MAHVAPQFNIKTGSDSQLFFSREITDDLNVNKGKVLDNVIEDAACYEYPQLTRRTGHSIKGTTESIESQELRKGRTKSAPRKGNSSSEGSLDIELSPETYDDIFEATLRNEWKAWESDNGDVYVNPDGIACAPGQFVSNGKAEDGGYHAVTLLGTDEDTCFIKVTDPTQYTIEQLTCGKSDIKYSALAQYGGNKGEDLYQEFQHLAVNTMNLSVSPGQIVTGSFGFMGANNPKLLQKNLGKEFVAVGTITEAEFNAGVFYTKTGDEYAKAAAYDSGTSYYAAFDGMVKELAVSDDGTKGRFVSPKTPAVTEKWLDQLDEKIATNTDQFTAREGFLFVNGRRVQYGSNLTLDLNNGLKQVFAIFERDAISTAPMSLDITGTLDAYLITNHSEFLYNYGINDQDVELVFCFQDKEDDPDYMYAVQVFKAKFDTDISQGAEELTISLPFTSFGERAMRIFRIRKNKIDITVNNAGATGKLNIALSDEIKPVAYNADDWVVTAKKTDGSVVVLTNPVYASGTLTYDFTKLSTGTDVIVNVKYKDNYAKKGYKL